MKVGLVVPVRLGQEYMKEWVEHHLSIGFDKIFLIDNNTVDGPNPMDVLTEYTDKIEYINLRGNQEKNRQNETNTKVYQEHWQEFDWLAFWDNDEYLFLNQDTNVHDWLNRDCFKGVDVIGVNWRMMSDNGLIHQDDRPVIERFTEYAPDSSKTVYDLVRRNCHIKSIVHCTKENIWFNHPHFPRSNNILITVNGTGNIIQSASPFCDPDYKLVELRHYQTKSTEEFCKYRLGSNRYYGQCRYDGCFVDTAKEIQCYFAMNKWTEEKRNYILQYCKDHDL